MLAGGVFGMVRRQRRGAVGDVPGMLGHWGAFPPTMLRNMPLIFVACFTCAEATSRYLISHAKHRSLGRHKMA